MSTQATTNTGTADTREKILDAAELLFVEHGFAATSLRAIAAKADVNLAATHYHFGSKKGLLAAVFHRRIQPVNTLRLEGLEKLETSGVPMTARSILEAFFLPFKSADIISTIPGLVGRLHGEPESISKPILEEEFTEVTERFQEALAMVLPQVDRAELRWRFHFMIGSMIQILRIQFPLGIGSTQESFNRGMERLVDFCIAGLEQADLGKQHD